MATVLFSQGDRGEKGDRGEQVSWDGDTVPSAPAVLCYLLQGRGALRGAEGCPMGARSGHTRMALLPCALLSL